MDVVKLNAPQGKIYKRVNESGTTFLRNFLAVNPEDWQLVDFAEFEEWQKEQQMQGENEA